MGIEPTSRVRRLTGFEDQGSHQTPFTSTRIGQPACFIGTPDDGTGPGGDRLVRQAGYLTNGSMLPEPANAAGAEGHPRSIQVLH